MIDQRQTLSGACLRTVLGTSAVVPTFKLLGRDEQLRGRGDPYILQLIDQIGSAWTVPTKIRDAALKDLSADVCLTIDGSGALTGFTFMRKSGNEQFDSSLKDALGTIKSLSPPPERFAHAAARGKLCPTFQKL